VGVAPLTYSEYAPAFERAGHRVEPLDISADTLSAGVDHVIVGNPNNPTTERIDREVLLRWHSQLTARGGTLIVDEAFADAYDDPTANRSLAAESGRDGLVVLRSVGKFYGLAGIRAGFVLSARLLRDALHNELGAWTVSGPARHAIQAAFKDYAWQAETRTVLKRESARLAELVGQQGFDAHTTPLFVWFETQHAAALHHALASKGIWTRLFEHGPTPSLRIGLTGTAEEWTRFAAAFETLT
jgi:cobalamin biosynthetic protein CobC